MLQKCSANASQHSCTGYAALCVLCVCEEFYEELRPTAGNESAKLDIDKARENTSKSIFMCVHVALCCAVPLLVHLISVMAQKPKYMPGSIFPT